MAHPIANIVFELVVWVVIYSAGVTAWVYRRRIWAALRRDDRQPPRSTL